MELQQLRSFVAVVEDMHVGRAARRLHVTQPTVSRQIAALERDLGVSLFSRAQRSLRLTTAGSVFLVEARAVLRRAEAARSLARRAVGGEVGTLRLGFVQSATYSLLPRLLAPFRASFPEVRVSAVAMTTLNQVAALRAGDLDVGMLRPRQPSGTPVALGDLELRVLSRDSMLVALPSGHRLTRKRRLALAELAGEPFVLYERESGSTHYDLIVERCARAGFAPDVVQHANDAATIVALVAAGVGVSLLLSPTPPIDPALIAYRPLKDAFPPWELAMAWSPTNPSTVLARFLDS